MSRDRIDQSRSFAEKLGLPYLLVADPEGELGAKLGVPSRVGFYARHTVIISPEGRIAAVLRDVDVKTHADQVASAIREAMAGAKSGGS